MAASQVDLHTHSTASDGELSPVELVREANRQGIRILGLTDHDTLAGIPEATAAANEAGISLAPGLELSTDRDETSIHLLGYFVNPGNAELGAALAEFAQLRDQRAVQMVAKLNTLGIGISLADVMALAEDGVVGRPHIARAMVSGGFVRSVQEAFDSYLVRGKPGYVPKAKLDPVDAVRLVLVAGGIPVLAHPKDLPDLDTWLDELIGAGLVGMEVHYGGYGRTAKNQLAILAHDRDLIPCGGSDFHGMATKRDRPLGQPEVPIESARRLFAAAGRELPF